MVGDAFYYFCGAPEVGGCYFEGDDVDSCSYAVDVTLVHGVPETGGVSQVAL